MKKFSKKLIIAFILIISLPVMACMNDMQHQGNWASPVLDNDVVIVPSNEGKIHKYFISQNSFDLLNEFPSSDSKIGSFYGDLVLNSDVVYGISYGSDDGEKCQNKSCISNLFAINIENLSSVWPLEFIQIDGAVVGGVKYSNDNLYFATSENDSFSEKGGFFYSVDAKTGQIEYKIPIENRVYNSIEINEDEKIAIVGDTSGNLSLYDIDNNKNLSPENRIISTVETGYSIISPAIQLIDSNLESNYCVGNINGEIKCFKLENLNGFSLNEWASLKIDGWIWSDMNLIADQKSLLVISLSGNLYRISVNIDSKSLKIIWEQEIDKNGKPVSGILIHEKGSLFNGIIPFDKDKVVITELNNGSIVEEFPFKEGVQSLPVISDDYMYFIDKDNKFRGFSLIDRSQRLCFDLKEMKGCD
tara:strand:+ start:600 stop:1850 length:1251 start_codon:yes stop_codon:yes gene_type:complete